MLNLTFVGIPPFLFLGEKEGIGGFKEGRKEVLYMYISRMRCLGKIFGRG